MKQAKVFPISRLSKQAIFVFVAMLCFGLSSTFAQEMTAKEKKNIEQVKSLISKAGLEFKDNKYRASAKIIANVQKKLARFAEDADGEYRELLEAQHKRMAKAHKMLVDKKQKLKDVQPLPQGKGGENASAMEGNVSFVSTIAPILNAKCGRCHVAQSRGQFSSRDYNTLMNSTTVTQGEPDVSYLIEVIEDGSMPKGGLTVTEAELKSLKTWIAEGAKFDGEDPTRSIAEMGGAGQGNAPAGRGRRNAMNATQKPTGNESVSFGAHVAPVLLEHCGRCHMARNPRGNFNMSQFRTFIRGGDSGSPVQAGNSANSTLIKRLRGQDGDIMPPAGKLNDAIIDRIAKWIDEGARFDTVDANLSMQAVASKGKSESLDHDELVAFRDKEAERIWTLVMSDIEPQRKQSENFRLMGSPIEEGIDKVAEEAESLARRIAKELGTSSRDHFVRGNGTIFLVTRRYDFGEFGTMLMKREFPRSLKAYWNHNATIAFSAILKSRGTTLDDLRVTMARQLTSVHVADLDPRIPRWFADGLGFCIAAEFFRKDPNVQTWEQDAITAAKSMNRINDFLVGRMDEDKSGLVSFLFVKQLRSDRGRFKKLMNGLKNGESFDAVFEETWGSTPVNLFQNNKRW